MNRRVVALRDSKLQLVSRLHAQAQRLQEIQQRLAAHLHRPPPVLPPILPEETPEEKLRCSRTTLERYCSLRERRYRGNLTCDCCALRVRKMISVGSLIAGKKAEIQRANIFKRIISVFVSLNRFKGSEEEEQEGAASLLEQLEKEMMEKKREEEQKRADVSSVTREEEETAEDEGAELSELEEELQRKEEIRLLHEQDSVLEEVGVNNQVLTE